MIKDDKMFDAMPFEFSFMNESFYGWEVKENVRIKTIKHNLI
jgi:hypothetical protein